MSRRKKLAARYALPVLTVIAAVALTLWFRSVLQANWPGQISSPLLLVAVAVSAWYGGCGPGLVAAVIALLSLEYLFLPPLYTIQMGWTDLPRVIVFLAASMLVSRLTAQRRQAESDLRHTEAKVRAARVIQQRLLPSAAPSMPPFDVAGSSFPADSVGGDYFDFFPLQDGAVGMVVADVSGHGFGPGLLMAETRAYLRALALTQDDVGEILTLTNRILMVDTDAQFLTVFLASVDLHSRSFVYAGAGHEAFLLQAGGSVKKLCSTSLPLCVQQNLIIPTSGRVELAEGDILLLLTDGVFETLSPDGTLFGMDRTYEVIYANRTRSAREIVAAIYEAVRQYSGGQPQADDVTIVVLKA